MSSGTPTARRIVVGVDGSPSSKHALRWAIGQAQLTESIVDAVICWLHPVMYGRAPMTIDPRPGRAAEQTLAQAITEVAGENPSAEIRQSALLGNAAEVLLERSRGAELLIVGTRGHGRLTSAMVGSVSRQCVQHALCPVVVVRPTDS